MECLQCGYVLLPFDKDCTRCERLKTQITPSEVSLTLPFSMPLPPQPRKSYAPVVIALFLSVSVSSSILYTAVRGNKPSQPTSLRRQVAQLPPAPTQRVTVMQISRPVNAQPQPDLQQQQIALQRLNQQTTQQANEERLRQEQIRQQELVQQQQQQRNREQRAAQQQEQNRQRSEQTQANMRQVQQLDDDVHFSFR